jgi:signal transduction histidine kinase
MKRKLFIVTVAFSVSFLFMVSLCLYSMGRFTTFSGYSGQVEKTGNIITCIHAAEISIRDIGLSERGYMITRDTMYIGNMNRAIDSVYCFLAAIKEMISDNQKQKNHLALVKATVALCIAAARANITYVDTTHSATESKYYDSSRNLMLESAQRLGEMAGIESSLLSERFKGQQFYGHLTDRTLRSLLTVFCILTLLLFLFMIRELRRRMIYQEELQATVIDLKRSQSELEEIAYVTSHDLQEPLRKIQLFSDLLLNPRGEANDNAIKELSDKISNAAGRGQELVVALMNLTNLSSAAEPEIAIDLNTIFKALMDEYASVIAENRVNITFQVMPLIKGHKEQLRILFRSLLDNSLKFTREGITPSVTFSYQLVYGIELYELNKGITHTKFHQITCSDNGIGFDKKFATRIFRIFQRLHNHQSPYAGKGIGLAICQRIMANHKGYIIADGNPGTGADFKLFFPL